METQHEHPKRCLGLTVESSEKPKWSENALAHNCLLLEFNLFLQEKDYMLDTKFCKKLKKSCRLVCTWWSVGVADINNYYFPNASLKSMKCNLYISIVPVLCLQSLLTFTPSPSTPRRYTHSLFQGSKSFLYSH